MADITTIRIWNPDTCQCISTFEGDGKRPCIAWSHDGMRIASVLYGMAINIREPNTGQQISLLQGDGWKVRHIAWSYDDSRLASLPRNSIIQIWNPVTSQCISTIEYTGNSCCIAWSFDETRLASGSPKMVNIWSSQTGQRKLTLGARATGSFHSPICWSKDGTRLASVGDQTLIIIWDTITGQFIYTVNSDTVQLIAWSYGGRRLETGSSDTTVKIWDKYNGECIRTLIGHRSSVICISWSHHSTWLVSAAYDGIMIYARFAS